MEFQQKILTLNDLFYAMFRPEEGREAVVKGHPRLAREDYFELFFPEELCRQYLTKTKSNLTWFFNDDSKNKAIKRTLIRMLGGGVQPILSTMHHKCREILWPDAQHAAFRKEELWAVLSRVYLPSALNVRLYITEQAGKRKEGECALRSFFDADPAAAVARIILTLSVASDAPEEMMGKIWSHQKQSFDAWEEERTPEGFARQGRLHYLSGQHEQAFECFEKAARLLSRAARTMEESDLYCRMGMMLATGDGHYRDEQKACQYLGLGCLEENPESYYLLAKYAEGECASTALEKAAELGHIGAIRELGNCCYYGRNRQADRNRAKQCFQQGMNHKSEDGAYCAYMLGRIYEEEQVLSAAVSAYKIAQERGNPEAAERLMQLNQYELPGQEVSAEQEQPQQERYCLVNSMSGNNRRFVESLPGDWTVAVLGDRTVKDVLHPMAAAIFAPEREQFPELVISLMSEDQEENLYQAAQVLQVLQGYVLKLGSRKWDAVQSVMIYVRAEHEYGSWMLDSAFAALQSVAFPLRLCDEAYDSADRLFHTAPLFLPCLEHQEAETVRLVVLGNTPEAMAVVQRAISLPLFPQNRVQIDVFCEKAGEMQQRFEQMCPGVVGASSAIGRSIPSFRECALGNGEVPRLLRELKQKRMAQKEMPNSETAEALGQGNYFVVAAGDDRENIRLAVGLRTELLKLDPSFRNLPFIAVRVRNPMAAWLTGNISADDKNRVYSWHNQYNLFCFGSEEQYTYRNLKQDLLEKRAQEVHLQYAGADLHRQKALASFYRRQYNRDSSRMVALYAHYRMFAAGLKLENWKLYAIPDEEVTLADRYAQWLRQKDNLEAAARLEHERWNCFMLATGWEQAMVSQVETYVQRGNPSHQLYLGKLHPFLCPWEELASGELQTAVAEAVHSRLPEKKIHDPRQEDARTACNTPALLVIR